MTTPTLEPPKQGDQPPGPAGPPDAPLPTAAAAAGRRAPLSLLPRAALVAGAAVLGLAALVAIASHDAPVWATPRDGRADRGELFLTIAILVGAGLMATVVVAVAVHRLILARRPDAPRLRTTLLRALPIAVVVLALLSLFAIARADLDPEPTEANRPPLEGSAQLGDFDHDGRPDIGIDQDGDGTIDSIAPLSGHGNTLRLDDRVGRIHLDGLLHDGDLGALDLDGDGSIDQLVTFDLDGDGMIDIDPSTGFDSSVLLDRLRPGGSDYDVPDIDSSDIDSSDLDDLDADDVDVDDDEPNIDDAEHDPERDDADRPPEPEDEPDDDGGGPDLGALGPILLILLAIVAAAILGAIIWSWYSRREPRQSPTPKPDGAADEPDEATRAAMAGTVANTIDSMLADPDPRTAIIGAYARMLEGLAACDVGRLDHEAPMEHLRRALTALRVRPKPLHRLIELFELARFSSHQLTEAHRTEALGALRAAATDLASTRTEPPSSPPPPQPVGAPR